MEKARKYAIAWSIVVMCVLCVIGISNMIFNHIRPEKANPLVWVGVVVGVICGFQFLPQAVKAIVEKHLEGVSLVTFSMCAFTSGLWAVYGWSIDNRVIWLVNIVGLLGSSVIVICKLMKDRVK